MAKIAGVYRITNIYNGMSYIGISNDIERRFGEHIRGSSLKKGDNSLIQRSIRKNGADCFHFEVLEELENESDRLEAEVMFIKRYNTMAPNGYNLTPGGESGPNMEGEDNPNYRPDLIDKLLYESYLELKSTYKVAEEFDCGTSTVTKRINKYCLDNDIEVPKMVNPNHRPDLNDKELYDSYLKLGSTYKVAEEFGCADSTVGKRIKKYCLDNGIEVPEVINSCNRPDLNDKELYEAYLELGSSVKVAEEFGCSNTTVFKRIKNYCYENNLEVPQMPNATHRPDLDSKELYESYLELGNYSEVAREFNTSDYTVKKRIEKYCSKNNIELPETINPIVRNDLSEKEIFEAYLELKSAKKVADKYDCSQKAVWNRIHKYCSDNNMSVPNVVNRNNRSDLSDKDLYEAYLELKSSYKVADKFDCSRNTVDRRIQKYCSDNGLEFPKVSNATRRPDLDNKDLYESYLELGSYGKVADLFGCAEGTVQNRVKEYCSDKNMEVPNVLNSINRTDLCNKDLYESYLELGSYSAVARNFNCTESTVRRRIKEYCLDNAIEVPKFANSSNRRDLDNALLYQAYLELGSYSAVARKFNCGATTVTKRIKKYVCDNNIEVPNVVNGANVLDLNDAMLYESYIELGTYDKVADKFGCAPMTVWRRIKKYKKENGL